MRKLLYYLSNFHNHFLPRRKKYIQKALMCVSFMLTSMPLCEASGTIEKMDKQLHQYYSWLGVPYINQEGVGKFQEFCDHNGFDTDNIEDELDGDMNNCQLLEFDAYFPSDLQDEDAKKEELFNFLKECKDVNIDGIQDELDGDIDDSQLLELNLYFPSDLEDEDAKKEEPFNFLKEYQDVDIHDIQERQVFMCKLIKKLKKNADSVSKAYNNRYISDYPYYLYPESGQENHVYIDTYIPLFDAMEIMKSIFCLNQPRPVFFWLCDKDKKKLGPTILDTGNGQVEKSEILSNTISRKIVEYAKNASFFQQIKNIDRYGIRKRKINIYSQPIFVLKMETLAERSNFKRMRFLGLPYLSKLAEGKIYRLHARSLLCKKYLRIQQLIDSRFWVYYFTENDLETICKMFKRYGYLKIEDKKVIEEIIDDIIKDRRENFQAISNPCRHHKENYFPPCPSCKKILEDKANSLKEVDAFENKFKNIKQTLKTTLKINIGKGWTFSIVYKAWLHQDQIKYIVDIYQLVAAYFY